MKTFYIVTGRIPYDDEDSIFVVEAKDMDEADAEFRRLILDANNGESTEVEDGEPVVYINAYVRVESEREPKIEWLNY